MHRITGKRKSTVLNAILGESVPNTQRPAPSDGFKFVFKNKKEPKVIVDESKPAVEADSHQVVMAIQESYTELEKPLAMDFSAYPSRSLHTNSRTAKSALLPNVRRRSSMALRGRRVSTIVPEASDGSLPSPHSSIQDSEYYRHISPDLPGPLRMKQLVLWGLESLSKQHSQSPLSTVIESTIQSLLDNQLSLSWYHSSRPDPSTPTSLLPNPRNTQLTVLIDTYKTFTLNAEQEIRAWELFINQAHSPQLFVSDSPLPELFLDSDPLLKQSEQFRKEKQHQISEMLQWTRSLPMKIDQIHRVCSLLRHHEQYIKRFTDNLFKRLNATCFPSLPQPISGDPMLGVLRALSSRATHVS